MPRTHGESPVSGITVEYRAWRNAKTRCYNPRSTPYAHYGGRGIKMCDRWRDSFELFLQDMGRRPSPTHSLDRVDVNGDYSPDNCRWSDKKAQRLNSRTAWGKRRAEGKPLMLTGFVPGAQTMTVRVTLANGSRATIVGDGERWKVTEEWR